MDIRTIRKTFSKIGFMYFLGAVVIMVVQLVTGVVAEKVLSQYSDDYNVYFAAVMLPMYLIAYPIMIALIRLVRVPSQPVEKHKMKLGQWLLAFLMCYAASYVCNLVSIVITGIIGMLKGAPVQNAIVDVALNLNPLIEFVIMVLCAPIFEELMFRKLLIDRVAPYGEGIAILLSGIMFGLFHGNLNQAVYAFCLGCFFGYIYVRTRNIWYTVTLHMLINFMGSVVAMFVINKSGYLELAQQLTGVSEEEMVLLVMDNMAGLMMFLAYALILVGIVIAGIVLLILNRKKFYLQPASCELPREGRLRTVFVNVGMGLFGIFWIVQIILQLFE